LLLVSGLVQADDEKNMRLSDRMLFKDPELAKPGACVMYREGGAGWILTEPVFWLKGTTVSSEVRTRKIDLCPVVAGKTIELYSREEFVQLANQQPCVSQPENIRTAEYGAVRLRIDEWETPWVKRAANMGRLYQGRYLDKTLRKGEFLEIDADLLVSCP